MNDGHGGEPVTHGRTLPRIQNVRMPHTVMRHIVAVVPGRGDGLIRQRDTPKRLACRGIGLLYRHPPRPAARSLAPRPHFAPDLHQVAPTATLAEHIRQRVHAVALGDGGKVNAHWHRLAQPIPHQFQAAKTHLRTGRCQRLGIGCFPAGARPKAPCVG